MAFAVQDSKLFSILMTCAEFKFLKFSFWESVWLRVLIHVILHRRFGVSACISVWRPEEYVLASKIAHQEYGNDTFFLRVILARFGPVPVSDIHQDFVVCCSRMGRISF